MVVYFNNIYIYQILPPIYHSGSHKSSSPPPDTWLSQKNQNAEIDAHEKMAGVSAAPITNIRTTSESASSHKSIVSGSGGASSITSLKLTRLGRFVK
jgi:hypothetical protein